MNMHVQHETKQEELNQDCTTITLNHIAFKNHHKFCFHLCLLVVHAHIIKILRNEMHSLEVILLADLDSLLKSVSVPVSQNSKSSFNVNITLINTDTCRTTGISIQFSFLKYSFHTVKSQ